jgi:hypothetical protein
MRHPARMKSLKGIMLSCPLLPWITPSPRGLAAQCPPLGAGCPPFGNRCQHLSDPPRPGTTASPVTRVSSGKAPATMVRRGAPRRRATPRDRSAAHRPVPPNALSRPACGSGADWRLAPLETNDLPFPLRQMF